MSQKIKFHTFHLLFRLFSDLADRSGGWSLFVRPKLLIGSLIVSLGLIIPEHVKSQRPQRDNVKGKEPKPSPKEVSQKNQLKDSTDYENIFCYVVEQMPEYPGGEQMLMSFITTNIIYPRQAITEKIQGMVVCRFVVGKDGSVSDVQVIRSVHPLLDAEAIRVIKSFPKWKPGRQKDKPVDVYYTLPIRFKL